MEQRLPIRGKLIFDPVDRTKKHGKQASWKRMAMVIIPDDTCAYYQWFIKKRYNITLNSPLRGPHFTVINDALSDMNDKWEDVKSQFNGQEIEMALDLDVRTDGEYWWFKVQSNDAMFVRNQLGMGTPFFGFHMTVGFANERNIEHSRYILETIKFYQK